jgi:PAS domain S-box-containing protein
MIEKLSQQRDLFESERSFRLLVEGVADYALYMLDPTGIITSWNIGGERIKGYSPGEILGQHFSRFYTESDRANGKPARALGTAREKGRYEEEGWRVRKDGTFFWASIVIDPIYEDGDLVGFVKITRDITERRNTQIKLEAMQKQLAESQKFDALGQLTGGVAHDFNNLLMIISGSLHMLKRGADDEAKIQRAISAIETATKRGAARR